YVTGNPIKEVLTHFMPRIDASDIKEKFGVEKGEYFLMTLHRAENVDIESRLAKFVAAFNKIYDEYKLPMIWSVHPRTRKRLRDTGLKLRDGIRAIEPLGLFEFVNLEKNAYCTLSDSGTVQEECAIFGVPTVTTRDTTERPETIEAGSNFISGCEPEAILRGVKTVTSGEHKWVAPPEYMTENVSDTITKIVLSYYI
ncbi:MAG: UDP-N-acetyl glucosamine 2-epimerase, partial [Candidatus Saccharimonadales bacterium]